jgi:hypothetical protein
MSTPVDLARNSGVPTEGIHLFKITEGKEQLSKTSGEPMWVLTLVCQDGEDKGKIVTVFMSLAPKARFKIDQLLDAIDAPKHGTVTVEQIPGHNIKGAVVYGEYNGSPTANIQGMWGADVDVKYSPPSKPSSETSSIDELSSGQKRKSPF